jgi:NAD-dependent deacetylase
MAPAERLAEAIAANDGTLLVLTGAGVSLASGIPTFRGSDDGAVWTRDVMDRATLRYFRRDPVGSWRWYRERLARLALARPNAAHHALAHLERWQLARRRGPFRLITQNVDSLHEQAGAAEPIKVHGSIDRARCADERCRNGARTRPVSSLDFSRFDDQASVDAIPRCAACGGLLRPHVLWFDEHYASHADYRWPTVLETCATMSLVLAIGTSFSVGVTDLVLTDAARRGVPLFVIDPAAREIGADARAVHVAERAEELLPRVVDRLAPLTRAV